MSARVFMLVVVIFVCCITDQVLMLFVPNSVLPST